MEDRITRDGEAFVGTMVVIFCTVVQVYELIPTSLSGIIGSGFGSDYWPPALTKTYGSSSELKDEFKLIVRQSMVPSAIEAWDGHLWTVHVSGFDSYGPKLCISHYGIAGTLIRTRDFHPGKKSNFI